jgi:hypothetical protein
MDNREKSTTRPCWLSCIKSGSRALVLAAGVGEMFCESCARAMTTHNARTARGERSIVESSYGQNQNPRAMQRLAVPYKTCAGGYHDVSAMRDRFHWARLLAFVTGLVNPELLLRNEYLAAENRVLRARLSSRLRLSGAERSTLAGIAKRLGGKALKDIAQRFDRFSETYPLQG